MSTTRESLDGLPYSYEGVVDGKLREYLEYFEGEVIQTTPSWPIRGEYRLWQRIPPPISQRKIFVVPLYSAVRRYDALNLQRRGTTVLFEQNTLRAFGALFGTCSILGQDLDGNPLKEMAPKQLQVVVSTTRELLGSHPLTLLIHDPIAVTTTSTTNRDQGSSNETKRVGRKALKVERKFPEFKEDELADLDTIAVADLRRFVQNLPNEPEDINYNHHKIPFNVVKAAMFVLAVHRHSLVNYDREEYSYLVIAVRKALAISATYIEKNPEIGNLNRLVEVVKRAVLKDPDKYWDASAKK